MADAAPASDAALAPPMLVQSAGMQTSQDPQAVMLADPIATGDLVVVVIGALSLLGTVGAPVTDDGGNAYTEAIGFENAGDGSNGYLYWTLATAPAQTISVDYKQPNAHTAFVFDFANAGPAAAKSSQSGTGSDLDTGAIPAAAGALLVAFTHQPNATTWSVPTDWNKLADNMNTFVLARVATTSGSYGAQFMSEGVSQPWDAHVVAFEK